MTDTVLQVLEPTLIPMSPQEIQVTKDSPTAAELQDYLAAWLDDAEKAEKIDDLSLIGRTLAEPGEAYKYSKRTPPDRFRVGEVCLHFTPHSYITAVATTIHGKFEHIVVTVGGEAPFELIDGQQVVNVFRGKVFNEFGKPSKRMPAEFKERMSSNFYLPGQWEEALLNYQEQAVSKINEIQTEKDQVRRRELLERIGLAVG